MEIEISSDSPLYIGINDDISQEMDISIYATRLRNMNDITTVRRDDLQVSVLVHRTIVWI